MCVYHSLRFLSDQREKVSDRRRSCTSKTDVNIEKVDLKSIHAIAEFVGIDKKAGLSRL